ncbi:SpoIIE family protein phosphatase [Nonomuraea sp. NPDC000554]|uniref:SpoIIE family protein phosphatase n=1 Tax=Nonomuraea sp. NPDC000554 TaxID=3154259 RepID=UPI00331A801A
MRSQAGFATGSKRNAPGLDALLVQAVQDAGAHIGTVYLLAPGEQVLLMDAAIGLPAQIARPWARIGLHGQVPAAEAVRERSLVWLSDHQELARCFPGAALALPYRFAMAAAPLHTGADDWGALLLLWPEPHPQQLTRHELEVIESTCRKMGTLLRQAADRGRPVLPGPRPRLLNPARARSAGPKQALAAMDCLNRLPESCAALDLDGRVTFISAAAAGLLGCPAADVLGRVPWEVLPWLRDPAFEDRHRAAVVSQQVTSWTARHPDGQKLTFHLYPDPSGVSLRITSDAAPPEQRAPIAEHSGGWAFWQTAGPVTVANRPARADALYNLMHLAAALTRAVTVRDVVDLVADKVMPVCGVQALVVSLAEGGRTRIVGSRGYAPVLVEHFDGVPLTSATPGERTQSTGEGAFFATWDELHQSYPHAEHLDGMSAWAFLPLIASGRPIGTCVLAYDHPHPFGPDERATLISLAGLIAQALDRARLFDAKDRLAQYLQAGLLPRSLPRIAGLDVAARYLPATSGMDVGGDFYDLIRLDETTAAAVIGDVQGHNIAAAALMGQVRTAVHAHAAAGASPREVLSHTNRLLIDLEQDLFTSCLYIHLDLRRQSLSLASAGHPPPLLRPADGRVEIIDVPPGLLLGIDPDAYYPVLEHPLPPGALLALYTDGLIEKPGTDLGHGLAGLVRRLTRAPRQPIAELADMLVQHHPHAGQRLDDIALLLLEYQG